MVRAARVRYIQSVRRHVIHVSAVWDRRTRTVFVHVSHARWAPSPAHWGGARGVRNATAAGTTDDIITNNGSEAATAEESAVANEVGRGMRTQRTSVWRKASARDRASSTTEVRE